MIHANNISNAGSKSFYFVGDGCEVVAVFEDSGSAESRARALNEQHDTREYVAYSRDYEETLESPCELAACRAAGLID